MNVDIAFKGVLVISICWAVLVVLVVLFDIYLI